MPVFTKRIDANIRDVGWDTSSELESSATSLGNPGAVTRSVSLRFISVTVQQGATINSAKITFIGSGVRNSQALAMKVHGVDEDNTAEFVIATPDTARTRTQTTAAIDWDATISTTDGSGHDTADITSIVQEIVNRGGWSSGNAMAFYVTDDGSGAGNYINVYEYATSSAKAALLTIDYDAESSSASASLSPSGSASPSGSVSASLSPSASESPSASPSPKPPSFFGLKIGKAGINVLNTADPDKLKFSSDYGTLKYLSKQSINLEIDANNGDIGCSGSYTHNLEYYPFTEVFVRIYIGSPAGNYQYCPFDGAGATVLYSANYKITTTQIVVYGHIDGVSVSTWSFDFLLFVYKNNLNLS